MPKEIMRRTAADNVYLHKDFHGALNCGIAYLEEHFGADAVRLFLANFARTYYAPLRAEIRTRGLDAIEEHFRKVYEIEGVEVTFERSPDELVIRVPECPAAAHIRKLGLTPAPLFHETTVTVNQVLCEGTDIEPELLEYDPETGRGVQRFRRRV